ncbi:hypothetical protein FRB95_011519, partial [Tulasnella sp. JGI-2019a]
NFDNQELILANDSDEHFYIGRSPTERQAALDCLGRISGAEPARGDITELVQAIKIRIEARLQHVEGWIRANTARFADDSPDVQVLRREFEDMSENIKANSQFCLMECTSCRLPCMLFRTHRPSRHDCCTSHRCLDKCDFLVDHPVLNEKLDGCKLSCVSHTTLMNWLDLDSHSAGHGGHHL